MDKQKSLVDNMDHIFWAEYIKSGLLSEQQVQIEVERGKEYS